MPDYGLSSQQLAVICALSNGATVTAAAAEAGVHRNTIDYWRRNLLPFQKALAGAQYDRALYFREKAEGLVDLAVQTIYEIISDAKAPASVRVKAALAILQLAIRPPQPKQQTELIIENVPSAHENPQPAPPPIPKAAPTTPPRTKVHETAQPSASKIGRNQTCPCGSGIKYKRCCLNKPLAAAASAALHATLINQ